MYKGLIHAHKHTHTHTLRGKGWAQTDTGVGDTSVLEWGLGGAGTATREPGMRCRNTCPGWHGGPLPDGEGEVPLVLATRPSQEAPMDPTALQQGLGVQPAEVSVKPPA